MSHVAIQSYDVYDFDKTVYAGDCSLDFYLYCIRTKPWLLAYVPYQAWFLALALLRVVDRTTFKSHFFIFLRHLSSPVETVEKFWSERAKKIKPWYADGDHSRDVIISASPEFLLAPVCASLGVSQLIATRMDIHTGKIDGKNCRGQEKVARLHETLGAPRIVRAYSDSLSDLPLLRLAEEPYIVRGDDRIRLQGYLRSKRRSAHSPTDIME